MACSMINCVCTEYGIALAEWEEVGLKRQVR